MKKTACPSMDATEKWELRSAEQKKRLTTTCYITYEGWLSYCTKLALPVQCKIKTISMTCRNAKEFRELMAFIFIAYGNYFFGGEADSAQLF